LHNSQGSPKLVCREETRFLGGQPGVAVQGVRPVEGSKSSEKDRTSLRHFFDEAGGGKRVWSVEKR